MMSSDNSPAKKQADDTQQGGGGGTGNSRKTTSSKAPPEQALKCPRCDSPNTKFCYYNNYSLTQPRHFCKTCRRYWTKGGALRNVPIGGGCRKNKRIRSSSSRLSCSLDSKDSGDSASDHMGLKFFHGISPAMDFQLGGLSLPRLNHHPSSSSAVVTSLYNNNNNSQFSPYGDVSVTSGLTLDPSGGAAGNNSFMGFNYPLTLGSGSGGGVGFHQNNMNTAMNVHSSLASSIESLSSINQDLHWKLQQQRLSMLFGTSIAGDSQTQPSQKDLQMNDLEKTQTAVPILFQNLEISKPKECAGGGDTAATEWFFGNSYAPPPVTPTPTNSGGNGGGNENNAGNWNSHGVVQAWGDLQQYNALP
ncbi:hypothetical protein ACLB2K_003907 [Fragaria x ananassa]